MLPSSALCLLMDQEAKEMARTHRQRTKIVVKIVHLLFLVCFFFPASVLVLVVEGVADDGACLLEVVGGREGLRPPETGTDS